MHNKNKLGGVINKLINSDSITVDCILFYCLMAIAPLKIDDRQL